MPTNDNGSCPSHSKALTPKGQSPAQSEDIQILESKIEKYRRLQNEIEQVISSSTSEKEALVKDIVDAIYKLGGHPTWLNVLSFGIIPIRNHLKRKKLRKVIECILRKLFDVTLGWYVMDYDDLKETCDYIGGRDYFSRGDHRHIYVAVIQKLKGGPIREKCIQLGIIDFVSEKLIDIRDNFLRFKQKEM